MLGNARPQARVAAAARSAGGSDRSAEHGHGRRRAHLLGEVRPLLRGGARIVPMEEGRYTVAAEHVEPLHRRAHDRVAGVLGTTFTGQMDDLESINELLARLEHGARPARAPARRRGIGGFISPFSQPELELGLPPSHGALDQRLKPQVRPGVPGHGNGRVPRRLGPARGARVPHQLPRRRHAQLLAELLAPDRRGVLQYFKFLRLGRARLRADRREHARQRADARERARRDRGPGARSATARCSRSSPCARRPATIDLFTLSPLLRERGWIVPPTRCRRTPSTSRAAHGRQGELLARHGRDALPRRRRACARCLRSGRACIRGRSAPPPGLLSLHPAAAASDPTWPLRGCGAARGGSVELALAATVDQQHRPDHDDHDQHNPAGDVAQFVMHGLCGRFF